MLLCLLDLGFERKGAQMIPTFGHMSNLVINVFFLSNHALDVSTMTYLYPQR